MESITKVFSDLVKPYIDTKDQALMNNIQTNGSKNICPVKTKLKRTTANITYTPNGDGSFSISNTTASGLADAFITSESGADSTLVYRVDDYFNRALPYVIGLSTQTEKVTFRLGFYDSSMTAIGAMSQNVSKYAVMDSLNTLDPNKEAVYFKIFLRVSNGQTIPANTIVYPMICLKSDYDLDPTYAPPSKTNQQLTKDTDYLVDNTEVNGAVNMLPNFRETVVDSGITYTVNADGSVTCNGTATANNHLEPVKTSDNYYLPAGTYKLTGCPSGGTDDTYYQRLYNLNNGAVQIGRDYGDGLIFTLTESTRIGLQIQFISGTTASNLTFKPMITVASYDGDYVPYAKSNKELTDNLIDLFDRINQNFKVITLNSFSNSSKTITVNGTIAGFLATYHSGNAENYDSLHMISCTPSEVPAVKTIASASAIELGLTEAGKITVTNTGSGSINAFLLLFRGTVTIS